MTDINARANLLKVETGAGDEPAACGRVHPAWAALMRICRDLQHGEIERIRIQDGIPVVVEVVKTGRKKEGERMEARAAWLLENLDPGQRARFTVSLWELKNSK